MFLQIEYQPNIHQRQWYDVRSEDCNFHRNQTFGRIDHLFVYFWKVFQYGQFKKKIGFFYIFPNLIKIKKFQEQLIILKGDYDGHFFAQGYFGSQSLHRKKIFQFFVPKRSGV